MRPNTSRQRSTYIGNRADVGQTYFYLRHDRVLGAGPVITFFLECAVHISFVSAALFLKWKPEAVTQGPLAGLLGLGLFFLATRWLSDAWRIHLGLFIVVSIFGCLMLSIQIANDREPALGVLWAMFPTLCLSSILLRILTTITPEQSRRWTCVALGVLATGALRDFVEESSQGPILLQRGVTIACCVLGILLVRGYVRRIAASPEVPVEAMIRLIDISRTGWEWRHAIRIPRTTFLCCVVSSLGGGYCAHRFLEEVGQSSAGLRLSSLQRAAEVAMTDPGSLRWLSELEWKVLVDDAAGHFLLLSVCGPLLIGCVSLRCMPWTYLFRAAKGLFTACVLWKTDRHPVPHAPGVAVAGHFRGRPIPLRGGSTLVLWILAMMVLVTRRPDLAGHIRGQFERAPFHEIWLSTLALAAAAAGAIAFFLLAMCGPWFAYVQQIINDARARNETPDAG